MTIRKILLFLLPALITLTSCVPVSHLTGKRSLKGYLDQNIVLGKGTTGLEVYDPQKKKVIISYNGQKYFTPASNTKLLTFYTGIHILGDSLPTIRYCLSGDSLIFSGMGDPTLLHPSFCSQPVMDFLRSSPDSLFYVPSPDLDEKFGPGWAWDDYPFDYSPQRSSLPVFGNVIWVHYPFKDSLEFIKPGIFRDSINLNTDSLGSITARKAPRDLFSNQFHVTLEGSGTLQGFDTLNTQIPFVYSRKLALEILKDNTGRDIRCIDTTFTCDWRILKSQPIDSVMKLMLYKSDNFIAEQILMLCSSLKTDTINTDWTIKYALDSLFPELKDNMTWVDGSGLSRYNLQTPDNFIRLLTRIYHEIPERLIFDLLPGYGPDLSMQLPAGDPRIYIYAKSGSMTHVYNMSGYMIDRKGKILFFSLMNNNFKGNVSDARMESEKILQWIRKKY